MKIQKILPNSEIYWKISASANMYILKLDKIYIFDTGNRGDRQFIISALDKLEVDPSKVDTVIFSHLHYDHIGNFDIFNNAKFYAGKRAIESFNKSKQDTILDGSMVIKFNVTLENVNSLKIPDIEIIATPGHTLGSIMLWDKNNAVLFSGDTLFSNKKLGRTDLPTSSKEELNKTLIKLIEYNYKILCPGHDYE